MALVDRSLPLLLLPIHFVFIKITIKIPHLNYTAQSSGWNVQFNGILSSSSFGRGHEGVGKSYNKRHFEKQTTHTLVSSPRIDAPHILVDLESICIPGNFTLD